MKILKEISATEKGQLLLTPRHPRPFLISILDFTGLGMFIQGVPKKMSDSAFLVIAASAA